MIFDNDGVLREKHDFVAYRCFCNKHSNMIEHSKCEDFSVYYFIMFDYLTKKESLRILLLSLKAGYTGAFL